MKLQHLYIHSYCIQSSERVSGRGPKWLKGWNTLGNNLQQHVVTISCCDKLQIALCTGEFLCKSVSVIEFCHCNKSPKIKSDWQNLCDLLCWKLCCGDKIFTKIPQHTKQFVTARCHPTCCLTCTQDWYVAMMNCSDISPSVFPPLQFTVDYRRPPLWIPS